MNEKEIKIKNSEYSIKGKDSKNIVFASYIPLSQFKEPIKKNRVD